MQKALIYCRVSTEEQAEKGYSLETQENFCRNFAKNNGYEVIKAYHDEGKSGTSLDRQALQDLLAKCQQDKSVKALIVQETDRLARNTKDHLTIKAILQKAGVKLISVAQPMLDDSPEGNMIDTILASVNQFQSDINSRKTRKALQEKFNQGWWPGWAPLGYINVSLGDSPDDRKARKIVQNDPEKWHLIKQGLRLYLSGNYSVDEIDDILYQRGLRSKTGKKVPHSIMTSTLKNPFYAGLMTWKGQKKMGKHEPMISLVEHQRVLQIMDSHNLHACRKRKHSFLLRGFIFCNICGQRYTAEKHPLKKTYYHCATMRKHSNRGQNIEDREMEKQVEDQFKKIQFSQEFISHIMEKLKKISQEQREIHDTEKQILYNQKKSIEIKRDKAEEKLLNGVLSDEAFVRLRTKFKEDLGIIQNRIDELEYRRDYDIDIIQEVVRLCRDIYRVYKGSSYEVKRQYLGLFWDKFLVEDRKIVEAIPTNIIRVLAQKKQVIISNNWLPVWEKFRMVDWEEIKRELNFLKLNTRQSYQAHNY